MTSLALSRAPFAKLSLDHIFSPAAITYTLVVPRLVRGIQTNYLEAYFFT
jgi:hypothetical protein